MSLTKKKGMPDKFKPLPEKHYLVTDQCFWMEHPPENYNPLDPKRTPHSIQLVDMETGTVVNLLSGSIIKVIEPKKLERQCTTSATATRYSA